MSKDIRQQFADTMLEVGQEDPLLTVLVSDISHFKLQPFAKACPGRFYNIGICEPAIVSMAAGLSKAGLHPVAHTITPFLIERCFEQIKLDFCYQNLGGNLISVGSAFDYAGLGCTHHCYNDFAILKCLPGINLFYPSSALEFDRLFRLNYKNGHLNYYRLPAQSHGHAFDAKEITHGSGIKITPGNDLTVVVTGPQLKNVLEACTVLKREGWDPEVIYIHTIHPLDENMILESVRKTRHVLVIEEHIFHGGLAHTIKSLLQTPNDIQLTYLCIPPEFLRGYGTYEDQCRRINLTAQGIVAKIRKDFKRRMVSA